MCVCKSCEFVCETCVCVFMYVCGVCLVVRASVCMDYSFPSNLMMQVPSSQVLCNPPNLC